MEKKKKKNEDEDKWRLAYVNSDENSENWWKPKKCKQQWFKWCPVNMAGKKWVEVEITSKIWLISENLWIGCGKCAKLCPFDAIAIINIRKELLNASIHRFGVHSFLLCGLPIPVKGKILGVTGSNGIGKTFALKILSGGFRPNLGNYMDPPSWDEVLSKFREIYPNSDMKYYFMRLLDEEDYIRAVIKPQYLDDVKKSEEGPRSS